MYQQCINCGGPALYSSICSDECGEEFNAYLQSEVDETATQPTQADQASA